MIDGRGWGRRLLVVVLGVGAGLAIGACKRKDLPAPVSTGTPAQLTTSAANATPQRGEPLTVDTADPIEPGGPPNILFLIGDDMGVERLAAYQEPTSTLGYPNTPTLDALAADGVLFRNAYTNPLCSPTRYNAGYGRYSRRGGVGRSLRFDKPFEVSTAEVNVAEVLRDAGYSTTAIGKWHLSSRAGPTNVTHPLREGFDHFSGTLGNLGPNYTDWNKTIDGGSPSRVSGYITSDTVDDALNRANTLPEPWFLWVAFHAAHRPWHVPPAALHTTGVTESSSDEEKFHAMIEAMDTEIGRLLVSIDPAVMENTVVVFLGDNGSKNDFIPASWDPSAGKGSPYESGINVPLIIQTPKTIARGRQSEVMVHSVDLLPTFAEFAGADVSRFVTTTGRWDAAAAAHAVGADMPWEADLAALSDGVLLDGASFAEAIETVGAAGPRKYVYVERFKDNGPPPYSFDRRAVHDGRYKLTDIDGVYGLHDLQGRHDDGPNLLSGPLAPVEQAAFERLSAVLEVHRQTLVFDP